jgi:hypothetical protein
LLQALAGGVLLLGAYFTYRQLLITREGQITDRYTKAVDQLGSEHLDVRVGGIYALERIARDSPDDRATIEEVLTAYVRDHAPWPRPPAPPSLPAIIHRLASFVRRQRSVLQRRRATDAAGQASPGQSDDQAAGPPRPAADVQAAVTVLGRRQLPPDGLRLLDLIRADLQGASLADANLQSASLADANLQGASLDRANLQSASLADANLHGASLDRADLQGAYLGHADLQGASLDGANLQGAHLATANLQRAYLGRANLQGAYLGRGDLLRASLGGANLQGMDLEAKLQGAVADAATRWPDGWNRARAEARGVRYRD